MYWLQRLTQEESLLDVYLISRRISSSKFNICAPAILCILMISFAYVGKLGFKADFDERSLAFGIRAIADTGFSFATSILGFLIAGFSIFASLTKPEVFITLAKIDHEEGEVSRLQFIFFNFLFTFIHFTIFIFPCAFVTVFLGDGGLAESVVQFFAKQIGPFRSDIILVTLFVMFSWLVYLLLLLKSFIWNLYQSVLVALGTEAIISGGEKDDVE